MRFKTLGFINVLFIKVHVQVLDYEILLEVHVLEPVIPENNPDHHHAKNNLQRVDFLPLYGNETKVYKDN